MLKNEKEQLSIPLLEIIQAAQQGLLCTERASKIYNGCTWLGFTFNKYEVHRAHLDLVTTFTFCSRQILNNFAYASQIS